MAQQEVLKLLERKKDWMTIKEISKSLGIGTGSINLNLQKLFKQGILIKRSKFNKKRWISIWKIKIILF